MYYFFAGELDENQKFYTLKDEEAHHCLNVLRKKKNEIIKITNGRGIIFTAKIIDIGKDFCGVEIIEYEAKSRLYKIHIAISPTKNIDRFEWFIEKSTEVGVDVITPIICKRTERKILKLERLEKIAIAALKQSCRHYAPIINQLISFNNFLKDNKNSDALKLIAHCIDTSKKNIFEVISKKNDVIILIGPEGDFTEDEINAAIVNEFIPITLGENRLRTETAGVVACGLLKFLIDFNN